MQRLVFDQPKHAKVLCVIETQGVCAKSCRDGTSYMVLPQLAHPSTEESRKRKQKQHTIPFQISVWQKGAWGTPIFVETSDLWQLDSWAKQRSQSIEGFEVFN
jgi:hypothetical protein